MEDVAAGAGAGAGAAAAAPDTAEVQAIVEEAIALGIALQGAVVLRQLVDAAIAGRRSTTTTDMYLPMLMEIMMPVLVT